MNRHNFCLEKQSLVLQPARVECIKNVPWLDNIKLNVVTNWGPFFSIIAIISFESHY